MRWRDAFDLALVAVVLGLVYTATVERGTAESRIDEAIETLLGLDPVVYVVVGAGLGVFFFVYLSVYRPRKDAGRRARR